MPFEIRNSDGRKIDMHVLNKEARNLWNISPNYELNVELFAAPPDNPDQDWMKVVGFAIESPMLLRENVMQQDWTDVKQTLFNMQMGQELEGFSVEYLAEKLSDTLKFLRPYYDLIDHWDSKGYTPINIK